MLAPARGLGSAVGTTVMASRERFRAVCAVPVCRADDGPSWLTNEPAELAAAGASDRAQEPFQRMNRQERVDREGQAASRVFCSEGVEGSRIRAPDRNWAPGRKPARVSKRDKFNFR